MNTFKEEYSVNNKHEYDKTKGIQESLLRKQLGAGGVAQLVECLSLMQEIRPPSYKSKIKSNNYAC